MEGKTDLQSLRLKHKTLKYIQNLDEDEFEQDLSLIEEEKKLPESGNYKLIHFLEHNSIEDEFYQFEEKYEDKDGKT